MIAATLMYSNAPTPSRVTAARATVAAIATSTVTKISGRSCTTALMMRFRRSLRQALLVDNRRSAKRRDSRYWALAAAASSSARRSITFFPITTP
jgi:hypothetical protein